MVGTFHLGPASREAILGFRLSSMYPMVEWDYGSNRKAWLGVLHLLLCLVPKSVSAGF
jgi:hypothetical protein